MSSVLAPVTLFGFNRADTMRRVLENLVNCENFQGNGATRYFYAFLDAPRNEGDVPRCNAVRSLLEEFRREFCTNLEIVFRDRNYGCSQNIPNGIQQVLDKHGRTIIVEDDILVSKYFLSYMDEALELFADRHDIFCINAWRPQTVKIPRKYPYDVYLNGRIMCWGWGTWKDRFDAVDFSMSDYKAFIANPKNVEAIDETGEGLRWMLDSQFIGTLDTWDVQCAYHMVKNKMWAIEPRMAMTKNIGFGGGVHAKAKRFYRGDTAKYWNFHPRLEKNITPKDYIVRQFRHAYFNQNIGTRVLRKMQRFLQLFSPLHDEPINV